MLENNTVQVECNEHYEIAGSGTTDQPGTRLEETVCMPDGSYDPILQCDGPWCDGLVPPPHAIAFPATRVPKPPTLSRVKILFVWPRFLSNYTLVADQENLRVQFVVWDYITSHLKVG